MLLEALRRARADGAPFALLPDGWAMVAAESATSSTPAYRPPPSRPTPATHHAAPATHHGPVARHHAARPASEQHARAPPAHSKVPLTQGLSIGGSRDAMGVLLARATHCVPRKLIPVYSPSYLSSPPQAEAAAQPVDAETEASVLARMKGLLGR